MLEIAEERVERKRGFYTHLTVFLMVNALLWSIYLWSGPEGLPWPAAVTLIWGIGVLVNFYDAFIDSDRHSKAVEKEYHKLRERKERTR